MEKETKSSELERQLQAFHKEQVKKCNDEIEEVMKKYNCQFDISVVLRQGQIIPRLGIILK